jgi:protein-S-isoprenylcysteine O-methyltransferase Ste14
MTATGQTTVLTPSIRRATRNSLFWIIAVVGVIVVAVVALLLRGVVGPDGETLSATNPAPAGSMAVAEVLKQHGVSVVETHTLVATTATAGSPASTTLLIFDPDGHLDAADLGTATSLSENVVLVSPSFRQLRAVVPEVAQAGKADATLSADCSVGAATMAGSVSGGGTAYRLVGDAADHALCFGSGGSAYSLIQVRQANTTITVLGLQNALTNEYVAQRGNAALALNLLGADQTLVWYLPSTADESAAIPSIAELTPPWVSAAALLAFCVAIAAAFWRGRRLGPLVVENLPVTVRASETMEGRARLYQRSSARLHALDSLRIGSIDRLGGLCGLPRSATVDDVIAAVAALTAADSQRVRDILVEGIPGNDRELIRYSDDVQRLERAVSDAVKA